VTEGEVVHVMRSQGDIGRQTARPVTPSGVADRMRGRGEGEAHDKGQGD
jgi:hypothetical protein